MWDWVIYIPVRKDTLTGWTRPLFVRGVVAGGGGKGGLVVGMVLVTVNMRVIVSLKVTERAGEGACGERA